MKTDELISRIKELIEELKKLNDEEIDCFVREMLEIYKERYNDRNYQLIKGYFLQIKERAGKSKMKNKVDSKEWYKKTLKNNIDQIEDERLLRCILVYVNECIKKNKDIWN